jgi:soluble lytic murein transglycosylase-like protein
VLQEALNRHRAELGLGSIGVSGTFGPSTQRAVVLFQRSRGLAGDGIAGPETWRKLLGQAGGPTPTTPSAPSPRSTTARVLAHRDAIQAASAKHGVPAALIAAIIEAESGGRAAIIGRSGPTRDVGLMQINPKAHPKYFRNNPDPTDPFRNVDYGTSLLRDNLRAFSGDLDKSIAAYNAGIGGVRRAAREGRDPREVTYHRGYVDQVLKNLGKYSNYF